MLKRLATTISLTLLAALIIVNLRSLYEGVFFYLRDYAAYKPIPANPIRHDGRYSSLYDLGPKHNMERRAYILNYLDSLGVSPKEIPIPNSTQTDILVTFDSTGPYSIFSAHYDKLFDEVEYQAASDNTASDSVFLASISELVQRGYHGSGAFLFTGEEERGLRGSRAFLSYALGEGRARITENINFDNIGRGRLAIRPSAAVPGFAFAIPLVGEFTYDGHEIKSSPPYPVAPTRLAQALIGVQPAITVYERFTAVSDSNVFQAANIDTVAISGDDIRFLELTWHTFADRIDLLDERNLDLAFELITRYAPN
jgi:Zn-dependent M28 family amino/carboxypeptidase